MRVFVIVAGLLIVTLVSACSSVSRARDIHDSPTSVVRAHLQGYMENNADLILASMAPTTRERLRGRLTEDDIKTVQIAMKKLWGVSGSAIDLNRITLKVDEDRGDKKYVDTLYNGLS